MTELTEEEKLCFRCVLDECKDIEDVECLIHQFRQKRGKIRKRPERIRSIEKIIDLVLNKRGNEVHGNSKIVFKVMEMIRNTPRWTTEQLAGECGLSLTTAHRWVGILRDKGLVEQTEKMRNSKTGGAVPAEWKGLIK